MSVDNDRRELLKLKQGIIENSETIPVDDYEVEMPKTRSEKVKNFIYYHKLILGIVVLLAVFIVIFILNFVIKEPPDIKMFSLGGYNMVMSERQTMAEQFEKVCPDFNENGSIHVDIVQSVDDDVISSFELYDELNKGDIAVFYGTEEKIQYVFSDMKKAYEIDIFGDISEFLPDAVDKGAYYIKLSNTALGKETGLNGDMCIAFKSTSSQAENAKEFIKNIYLGNVQ